MLDSSELLIHHLCKICAKVTEDGFCLSQRPDAKLFHLPEQEAMFLKCSDFVKIITSYV